MVMRQEGEMKQVIGLKALQWDGSNDPTFGAFEGHTAIATLTNNTSQALVCTTELYLDVTKVASSGVSSAFTIPAGGSIDLSYTVRLAGAGGPYHVYIDVWSGSVLLAHYVATEDVTVTGLPPVPCVYCGATFSIQAALVAHMQSNHPGMPYLVGMQLTKTTIKQGPVYLDGSSDYSAPANVSVYVPGSSSYQFLFWIYSDACAVGFNINGLAAGFYSSGIAIIARGVIGPPPQWMYVPTGTYPIYTGCALISDSTVYWPYKGAGAGLSVTVI
jgi:hypothetical protein